MGSQQKLLLRREKLDESLGAAALPRTAATATPGDKSWLLLFPWEQRLKLREWLLTSAIILMPDLPWQQRLNQINPSEHCIKPLCLANERTIRFNFTIYYNMIIRLCFQMVYDTASCLLPLHSLFMMAMMLGPCSLSIWEQWQMLGFTHSPTISARHHCIICYLRFPTFHSHPIDIYAFAAPLPYTRWIPNDALKAIYW